MDFHPEAKRLTTLAFYKHSKKEVEFFQRWDDDSDRPTDPLFDGPVTDLEPYFGTYDPNDPAPWAWDLEPELFQLDCTWSEMLVELENRGPTD